MFAVKSSFGLFRCAVNAAVVAGVVAIAPSTASADANDLALNRLTFYDGAPAGSAMPDWQYRGGCGTGAAINPYARCYADNTLWANLINELGGALAPSLLAPASTVGYNRVYVAYEHGITNINSTTARPDLLYWHRGTEGVPGSTRGDGTERTRTRVADVLFVSRLHMRHGLPYGFELGVQGSYLHDSGLVAMGADIKWALKEGFRRGIGYFPDIAVRGSVNTLVGNQQLYLTIVGVDALLSKPITVTGSLTLTPYIGAQGLLVLGDSQVIDGTPTRSGYQECTRRRTVYAADGSSSLVCDAAAANVPAMGVENDSVNDLVFTPVRLLRMRGMGGLRIKYGLFTFTAEFIMDLTAPSWMTGSCNPMGTTTQPSYCVTGRPMDGSGVRDQIRVNQDFRQYTINMGAGVTF